MLLCDAAQVAEGKLYILGGGWSITGPEPMPSAIAIKVDVGWHETEKMHHWELFLMDADGEPVMFDTPEGRQPVEVRGDFQVGRAEGIPAGSTVDFAFAVNIGPLPLPAATRFTWQLSIDGISDENWSLAFTTRPAETPV